MRGPLAAMSQVREWRKSHQCAFPNQSKTLKSLMTRHTSFHRLRGSQGHLDHYRRREIKPMQQHFRAWSLMKLKRMSQARRGILHIAQSGFKQVFHTVPLMHKGQSALSFLVRWSTAITFKSWGYAFRDNWQAHRQVLPGQQSCRSPWKYDSMQQHPHLMALHFQAKTRDVTTEHPNV